MITIDLLVALTGLLAGAGLALARVTERTHYLGVIGAFMAAIASVWTHRFGSTPSSAVVLIVDLAAIPVVVGWVLYVIMVSRDERRPPERRRETISQSAATLAFITGVYAVVAAITATK